MEPRIPFNGDQPTSPFSQTLGQDTRTGADFNHKIIRSYLCRAKDQIANRRRDEETLPEAFFRQQMVLAEQRAGLVSKRRWSIDVTSPAHSLKHHGCVLVPRVRMIILSQGLCPPRPSSDVMGCQIELSRIASANSEKA